jgi:hypothetical protein
VDTITPATDITTAAATGKLTAAEIGAENCPVEMRDLGKRIAAHLEKAAHAEQKAENHRIAAGQLLAQAKKACDEGGFAAFRERFCPQLGKSRAYELLAIATGKKTVEEVRADERARKANTRARQKAAANSGTVPEKSQPLNRSDANVIAGVSAPTPEPSPPTSEAAPVEHTAAGTKSTGADAPTVEEAEAKRTDADEQNDPLVVDRNEDEIEATSWFSSKIKPIFEGSIKNDEAKSALALAQFKRACASFLPQLTIKDLETAQSIFCVISDLRYEVELAEHEAKQAAADAKRIKWEASHPKEAKNKARGRAQHDAMENDIEEAKAEAKENGERWGDIKDKWIEEWIADNWDAEQEGEFEKDFQEQWAREHGATHKDADLPLGFGRD